MNELINAKELLFCAVPVFCGKVMMKGSRAKPIARNKIGRIKETKKIGKTEGNEVQHGNGNFKLFWKHAFERLIDCCLHQAELQLNEETINCVGKSVIPNPTGFTGSGTLTNAYRHAHTHTPHWHAHKLFVCLCISMYMCTKMFEMALYLDLCGVNESNQVSLLWGQGWFTWFNVWPWC